MNAPTVLPHETDPLGAVVGATDDAAPLKSLRMSWEPPLLTEYIVAGSVGLLITGSVLPPARGISAMLEWYSPPIRSVSEPTQSPWLVASMSWTPTPRVRPGFQDHGIPLTALRP